MYIPWPSTLRITQFSVGHRPIQAELTSEVSSARAVVTTAPGRFRGVVVVEAGIEHLSWLVRMSDGRNWTRIPHHLTTLPSNLAAITVDRSVSGSPSEFVATNSADAAAAPVGAIVRGPTNYHVISGVNGATISLHPAPSPQLSMGDTMTRDETFVAFMESGSGPPLLTHSPDWIESISLTWVEAVGKVA